MKKYTIFFLTIPLFLYSCLHRQEDESAKKSENTVLAPINIQFKNRPDINSKFHFTERLWIGKVNLVYIFNGNDNDVFQLYPEKKPADITVLPKQKFIVLRHYVNHLDYNDYLIQNGDSVIIQYVSKKPVLSLINRAHQKHDLLVDELVRLQFDSGKYSPMASYLGAMAFNGREVLSNRSKLPGAKKMTPKQKEERDLPNIIKIKNQQYGPAVEYLKKENMLLDSLKKLGEISDAPYAYYKERAKYYTYLMDVETERITYQQITEVLSPHKPRQQSFPEPYYYELLESVANTHFVAKSDFFPLDDGTNRDYRQLYKAIDTSSVFSTDGRDYLLTREIKRIRSAFPLPEFLDFFTKYQQRVQDSALVMAMKEEFAIDFDSSRLETASVILSDAKGTKLTLEDLKKQHLGKVLYIDFWASWCAPCREALPKSAELREALKYKDVVFVYLSIDSNVKNWKKASIVEQLDRYEQNYLVINPQNAEFMKSTKLNEIPRYMIFGKTGRLLYSNAPRVESSETGILLTNLAVKKN
ncbi:TlpA family protein disulfide reductase [Arundinibacter roseus]|uniref:TlpA family protein disulfide reductase n=1 Tax=Arundinibacter roseus TaxID=2070510 RepID=A0A4R4JV69_9BACT|nr:TlpA disulfide reductase family protein [Arundinibacter roseus]TDB57956.1 TlpA family protein disulfide reductase [Arundinibacter roseus]